MKKPLVIVLSETRAHELTFDNFKTNVIDELNADLCICIGTKPNYDYENPFYKLAKYKFLYDEPDDFGEAFDYAKSIISIDRPKYEKIQTVDNIQQINFYGNNEDTNINDLDDDEIVAFSKNFPNDHYKNKIYGINKNPNNSNLNEFITIYKKPIYWREFLKLKDQFLGGIKDKENQHPGSAGIIIFFRWFLLKNLLENDLIEKYDRFIITRSDFIYQLPHPKLELLDEKYLWLPNSEHYGGFTDRHVVLSKNNIESYLNILNNLILRSNVYHCKLSDGSLWNLERLIKLHFEQNNVLHLVREFPYIMFSVNTKNGSHRWTSGIFLEEAGHYVKYETEYEKSSEYKNDFDNSSLTIDEFYKPHIQSSTIYS
jgi:hypothetical protein